MEEVKWRKGEETTLRGRKERKDRKDRKERKEGGLGLLPN